ncbi:MULTISPECIES: hypothetical protein [unclassified Arcicella]|uniref:hypothetical protein n=1 Tax=unclassified Arcicella TaxID=2644986 RepID=UPI00285953F3|nr:MULTISPECIES: hypothetical protein [unclassified Arcicella]MDR6564222.1 hypothetical protein [Arcicella sp. BE51]MDR6811531.1 hypothetical protein [Arcicella sp. BE140]MDR6823057.1 hypothetical protein [Arcicella sp. BE139]
MGTSKSFSDVKHSMVPNWGNLSSSLTSNCDSSVLPDQKLQSIMVNFVSALGGASTGGRGGSKVGGRSSIRTAKKIGGVFSKFISSGNNIRQTLESTGLTDIDNQTVGDVINHLIEYCSGNATSIDDNAAKEATRLLLEELMGQAESIDKLQTLLEETFATNTLEDIIIKYFGYYINELLSKWFYEKLIKKSKNEGDCNNLFHQIKNFIVERVGDMHKNNPLQNIDWSSNEADRLIKNIQQDILTVFE